MAAVTGLDGGLLVGRDHVLVRLEGPSLPPSFVEVQHPPGFMPEVGVSREDPGAMVEGTDGIFGEPPPDGGPRDLSHEAPSDHLPGHLLGAPTTQGHSGGGRKLTGDGLHLHPYFWGKSSGACPNEVDLPVPLTLLVESLAPLPDHLRAGFQPGCYLLVGDFFGGQKNDPGANHFPVGTGVRTYPLLQDGALLFGRLDAKRALAGHVPSFLDETISVEKPYPGTQKRTHQRSSVRAHLGTRILLPKRC